MLPCDFIYQSKFTYLTYIKAHVVVYVDKHMKHLSYFIVKFVNELFGNNQLSA